MLQYIAKRLLLALPTLFLVSVIVFGLIRLVPGDPAQVLLGEDADKDSIAAIDRKSTRLNSSHYSRSRMPSSA